MTDPEEKRKRIGKVFIDVFEEEAGRLGDVGYLVQGTLYPDVIESISVRGPSAVIKSHHNVGGLPEKMNLKLIEPLRELFKDEVRLIGRELGVPEEILGRHPFRVLVWLFAFLETSRRRRSVWSRLPIAYSMKSCGWRVVPLGVAGFSSAAAGVDCRRDGRRAHV